VGATVATSALTNSGMSTNFSQFNATLIKYMFVKSGITLFFTFFMTI
jgi:hypothetical protein